MRRRKKNSHAAARAPVSLCTSGLTYLLTAAQVVRDHGCTVVGDGKQSNAGHPLLNLLLIHRKGAEHVDTFDATMVDRKTGEFLSVLMDAYLTSDDADYDADKEVVLGADDDAAIALGEADDDDANARITEITPATAALVRKMVTDNENITKIRVQDVVQIVLDGAKSCRCS
jgi:hypothetical protein